MSGFGLSLLLAGGLAASGVYQISIISHDITTTRVLEDDVQRALPFNEAAETIRRAAIRYRFDSDRAQSVQIAAARDSPTAPLGASAKATPFENPLDDTMLSSSLTQQMVTAASFIGSMLLAILIGNAIGCLTTDAMRQFPDEDTPIALPSINRKNKIAQPAVVLLVFKSNMIEAGDQTRKVFKITQDIFGRECPTPRSDTVFGAERVFRAITTRCVPLHSATGGRS